MYNIYIALFATYVQGQLRFSKPIKMHVKIHLHNSTLYIYREGKKKTFTQPSTLWHVTRPAGALHEINRRNIETCTIRIRVYMYVYRYIQVPWQEKKAYAPTFMYNPSSITCMSSKSFVTTQEYAHTPSTTKKMTKETELSGHVCSIARPRFGSLQLLVSETEDLAKQQTHEMKTFSSAPLFTFLTPMSSTLHRV